jgi:hypothetical protein
MKTISEKYLSNFFWTSNMVVIAEKINPDAETTPKRVRGKVQDQDKLNT